MTHFVKNIYKTAEQTTATTNTRLSLNRLSFPLFLNVSLQKKINLQHKRSRKPDLVGALGLKSNNKYELILTLICSTACTHERVVGLNCGGDGLC